MNNNDGNSDNSNNSINDDKVESEFEWLLQSSSNKS